MSQVKTIAAPFEEVRAASTASGGTALTTTLTLVALPENADWVSCIAHNFVGALVVRLLLNPWLTVIRTADALASVGTDNSAELQDGDTTDVAMDAFDTAANKDFLYVGSWLPFRGVRITAGSDPQNTASVLTVKYWNGSAWTDISATDGSASGGATFAATGNVTWTVPAADTVWVPASLQAIGDVAATTALFNATFTPKTPYLAPLYWTRWEVSATTEATWNVVGMQPLNRSILYAEYPEGFGLEMSADVGTSGFSCVEALTDAGTASLVVNVGTRPDTAQRRIS